MRGALGGVCTRMFYSALLNQHLVGSVLPNSGSCLPTESKQFLNDHL